MFAVPERDRLRDQLVARARQDPQVRADWTAYLYDQRGALHHLDIWADGTL